MATDGGPPRRFDGGVSHTKPARASGGTASHSPVQKVSWKATMSGPSAEKKERVASMAGTHARPSPYHASEIAASADV